MLVQCKNCGAPLDVNGTERFVRCSYCDKVNRVRTMQTMAVQTPATWTPPPVWQPPPQFGPFRPFTYHPVSSPLANRLPFIILGFVLLTSVGGVLPFAVSMVADSASPRAPAPRGTRPPTAGIVTVDLAASPRPDLPAVVGRGGRPVSRVTGRPQCAGYIATQPQFQLSTREFTAFSITPRSSEAVLLIATATGQRLCSTGDALALEGVLPPGTHRLWVGVHQDGASPSVTLDIRAASQRLRPSNTPLFAALSDSRMDITTVARYSAIVDGTVDVSTLDETCRGFVSQGPQLTVELMEGRGMAFAFEQHTDELVLLVRTPQRRFLCEIVAPVGPSALSFELPRGDNAVWVGVTDLAAAGQYTLATRAAD